MLKSIGILSFVVILITLILFILALFTKGLTHDLFLETGVFLISIKLIIMGYKNSNSSKEILDEIKKIRKKLETIND